LFDLLFESAAEYDKRIAFVPSARAFCFRSTRRRVFEIMSFSRRFRTDEEEKKKKTINARGTPSSVSKESRFVGIAGRVSRPSGKIPTPVEHVTFAFITLPVHGIFYHGLFDERA